MCKKTLQLLGSLVLGILLSGPVLAFDEGIDYKTVPAPQITETQGKVEVLELFWYGCPHCYHLEPELNAWLAHKPDYVVFRRMPAVLGDNWKMGAKVFYAAELLGVLDKIHGPFFKAIHEDNLAIDNSDKLADWFVTQGINRENFLKAFNSFDVDSKVRRAGQISKAIEIDGVPSFLVNGRYLTSPSMTASTEKAFQVINELAAKEAHVTVTMLTPNPPPQK